MKNLNAALTILVIYFVSIFAHADVAVQYRVSRTHGLFKFVMAISGEPHITPNIKEAFERSKFKEDPKVIEALKNMAAIQNDLHIGMDYYGESTVTDRRGGMDVITFINIQSIFATSIDDLNTRTMGMLPMASHTKLFSAIKDLDAAYEEIFWRKSSSALYKAQSELESIAKKVKINDMFKKTEKFYEASWPTDTPFVIGLYPVLYIKDYGQNQTSSQSLGNVEEHGVMIGTTGKDRGSFGVVFHELSHSVYGAQSAEVMAKWEKYFSDSKSPYRLQASNWMNETLATVIGNGWAYHLQNQELEKDSWYNHPIIDKYSRALYPKTVEYLAANKSLDQEYADFAIQKFAELFPDGIYDFGTLLNRVVILSDNQLSNQRDFIRILREDYEISGIGASSPLDNPESIASVKSRPRSTLMFVFSQKNRGSMKRALAELPELGTQSKMLLSMKPRQILSYQDKNARTVLGIQVEKPQDLLDAVSFMKKNKINPTKLLTSF